MIFINIIIKSAPIGTVKRNIAIAKPAVSKGGNSLIIGKDYAYE